MDHVRAFDIPVDDMKRAKEFYEKAFGWQISPVPGSGGDFNAAKTVPVDRDEEPQIRGAINGGLFKRGTHGLSDTFLEVSVQSIDECVKRAVEGGGRLVKAKAPILDIAFFAVVRDTEGNAIGLWEDAKK